MGIYDGPVMFDDGTQARDAMAARRHQQNLEYEQRLATRIERYHTQVLADLDREAARPDRAVPKPQKKRWKQTFGPKRGRGRGKR